MITSVVQRWRSGRASYRPAGETIDTRRYDVAAIADDTTAKSFVVGHHYSGSYPAARFRFGIYRGDELGGVAVFSVPAQPLALACLPGGDGERVELGRLVLLDEIPANAESWFIARCFEQLREHGISGVVAFSDPAARTNESGLRVFPGHIGTIYQATNATYLGRSRAESRLLLPDGTVLHRRAISKIRRRDRGWRYASDILISHGADQLECGDDPRAWLDRWLPRLTRHLAHPGNHKYAWTLHRRDRKFLPASLPYPKFR